MTLLETALTASLWAFGIGGWLAYLRERGRSRDYVTDLLQVVYDNGLGTGDLRRSLEWREVADRVERWND